MDAEESEATTPPIKKPFGAATPKRLITNSDNLNNNYNIFDDFERPPASIDFVSISLSECLPTPEVVGSRLKAIEDTGARYNYSDSWSPSWEKDFLTIHDPSKATIDYLVRNHGDVRVRGIEISLDYCLKDGSNDLGKLKTLHAHLVHCLFPGHGLIRKTFIKTGKNAKTGEDVGHYVRDTLKTKNGGTSVIWEAAYQGFKVRLYIKTKDNGIDIGRHSVRLEINVSGAELAKTFNPDPVKARTSTRQAVPEINGLSFSAENELIAERMRTALDKARHIHKTPGFIPEGGEWITVADGPFRLHMLPRLFGETRRYLSKFFCVAEGIKPKPKRTRAAGTTAARIASANNSEAARVSRKWITYGASWANKHAYGIKPNVQANKQIGRALDEFQRHFSN